MSSKRNQHVVPHADGWAVRGAGATRATETFERKTEICKRSYDFPYVATLGAGEPLSVTVRPDAAGVALLERLLADVCAPR